MPFSVWMFYFISVGIVVLLYVAKETALRSDDRAGATRVFAVIAVICVPITWAASPDWDNQHVYRIAIFVGSPIHTLTVPCVSFAIDSARSSNRRPDEWIWRIPLELFVAVPMWFVFWVYFEFFVLGWIWI